jgi:predicted regulator of Ras-like GTPase activity (Roadblock/LC7/MglB family)
MLVSLNREHNEYLESVLIGLLIQSEADAVFLCDRAGNIVAQHCAQHYDQMDNIAALASGSFFATRILAGLLGEDEFRQVIHQGASTSIYMQYMQADLLVLIVFGRRSNPGLVKLYAGECCKAIDEFAARTDLLKPGVISPITVEIDSSKQPFSRAKTTV